MFGGIVQLPARAILAAVMIFSAFYMVAAAISSISVFASLNKAYLVDDPGRSTGDGIRLAIMQRQPLQEKPRKRLPSDLFRQKVDDRLK